MSKLAGIALLLTVAASGADSKISPSEKPPPSRLTDFTAWQPLFLARNSVVNTSKPKDFYDSLFEYRWKSERTLSSDVCAVEIRHAEDAEDSHTLPEIDIFYADAPSRGTLHRYRYTAHDVALGGKDKHVLLRQTNCGYIEIVAWNK